MFERQLVEAQAASEVRPDLPAAELAQIFTGGIHGLLRGWFESGRRGSLAERAPILVDLLFEGVTP